eukprot:767911-Hanusia_phi.AAC.3
MSKPCCLPRRVDLHELGLGWVHLKLWKSILQAEVRRPPKRYSQQTHEMLLRIRAELAKDLAGVEAVDGFGRLTGFSGQEGVERSTNVEDVEANIAEEVFRRVFVLLGRDPVLVHSEPLESHPLV